MLQIPSFMRVDARRNRGRSMFRKRRTRELAQETLGPAGRIADFRHIKFPLDGETHLPLAVAGAARSVSGNEPNCPKDFRRKQMGTLKIGRQMPTGNKLAKTNADRKLQIGEILLQGQLDLPLLAHVLNDSGMGGKKSRPP